MEEHQDVGGTRLLMVDPNSGTYEEKVALGDFVTNVDTLPLSPSCALCAPTQCILQDLYHCGYPTKTWLQQAHHEPSLNRRDTHSLVLMMAPRPQYFFFRW